VDVTDAANWRLTLPMVQVHSMGTPLYGLMAMQIYTIAEKPKKQGPDARAGDISNQNARAHLAQFSLLSLSLSILREVRIVSLFLHDVSECRPSPISVTTGKKYRYILTLLYTLD
jgi:hypothetical protein